MIDSIEIRNAGIKVEVIERPLGPLANVPSTSDEAFPLDIDGFGIDSSGALYYDTAQAPAPTERAEVFYIPSQGFVFEVA